MGEVPAGQALLRSGARPGDDVYVSGALGDAALALAAMTGRTRIDVDALAAARTRLEMPTRALRSACAARHSNRGDRRFGWPCRRPCAYPRALGRRCDGGACGHSRSPTLARLASGDGRALALECLLAGGDDYELCFTAPRAAADRVATIAARTALPLARIGTINADPGLVVRDEHGVPLPAVPRAYDHFG